MTTNGKAKRNSTPLTFGRAVDMIESILADEAKERDEVLYRLKERQTERRLRVLSRCDSETKSRVIQYLHQQEEQSE